jgi:hypothetical protein
VGALSVCCIAVTIAAQQTRGKVNDPSSLDGAVFGTAPFTSTVDWYKPPPGDWLKPSKCGLQIPRELIIGLPPSLHQRAISLLGDADFVPLTDEQTRQLAGQINPNAVLKSLIQQRTEKLRFFSEHPPSGFRGRELERQKTLHHSIMSQLSSDIEQFRKWKDRLRPYLIKAVALQGRQGFGATFISDDLLIEQVALGSHPLPMKKMPVVAFLPKEPHKIYTAVSMME